jgi:hypothetical protein
MKVLLNVFLLFFLLHQGFCQTQVLDKETNKPIPYVHIISSEGVILGLSNLNGMISWSKIHNLHTSSKIDSIEILHIAYQNKKLTFHSLRKKKVLYLIQTEIPLHTITVRSRTPDYLVLKGFFRSYQLDNNIPKAYMDGIVEYYISIKKDKSLKMRLLENRSFKNPLLFNLKVKEKGAVTVESGNRTGPPYIEAKTILALANYELTKITDTDYKIVQDNDTIGLIAADTNQHLVKTAIDITTPQRSYSRSLFGHIFKFVNISVSESYASHQFPHPTKSELIASKRYVKQYLSHKKSKKEPIQVESFHEFYVLEKKYNSISQFKQINTSTIFGTRNTNYSKPFWEDTKSQGIPKLPNFIDNLLGGTLEVY